MVCVWAIVIGRGVMEKMVMREVGVEYKKVGTGERQEGWRFMVRCSLRRMRSVSIAVLVVCSVWLLTGCELLSDIQDEIQAEELARKYGEELSRSELGPYRSFSRKEYFKHKCDTEAGEFIYRTVENVEGVFQMRLREPRDLIARLRKGDIPEDPWGHTNTDARQPFAPFMRAYDYFETSKGLKDRGDRWNRDVFASRPDYGPGDLWRYSLGEPDGNEYRLRRRGEAVTRPLVVQRIETIKSRYGYTWREVRDKYDRHFGVWGGELIVKDLETDEVLAISRGFFDANYSICPKRGMKRLVYDFVRQVLQPKQIKIKMKVSKYQFFPKAGEEMFSV